MRVLVSYLAEARMRLMYGRDRNPTYRQLVHDVPLPYRRRQALRPTQSRSTA